MSDSNKKAKEAALQKLMDLMDSQEADSLRGLKKGPSTLIVEKPEDDDEEEEDEKGGLPADFKDAWEKLKGTPLASGDEDEGIESDEPDAKGDDVLSDDEKQRISDLYHKHCK